MCCNQRQLTIMGQPWLKIDQYLACNGDQKWTAPANEVPIVTAVEKAGALPHA